MKLSENILTYIQQSQCKNITLITILKNWGLEAQKVKEKKSELHCYINGPEKLSVSKTYLIEAFIILLLSSKL